jgi:hypothetical protein
MNVIATRTLGAHLLAALWLAAAQAAACPPPGTTKAELLAMKARQWALDDPAARSRLAAGLLGCLRDADPVLRDEIGFEALQHWLRAPALDRVTVRALGTQLLADLETPDPAGFGPPFAALALAEVIRDDRRRGVWSDTERDAALVRVARYLRGVTDRRGFQSGDGWRHGVAHGADALMQFALNPALSRAQLDRILDAVASQVAPADAAPYVHGEGERLARPVLFVARRGLHEAVEWSAWLNRVAAPAAPAPGAPTTPATLARLHNAKAFVFALYAGVQESGDAALRERLLPGLREALRMLP